MKTMHSWLSEYGESHQNSVNKTIHWICVPSIFFSITGLLYTVKLPFHFPDGMPFNLAIFVLLAAIIYYFILSPTLWLGMALFGFICLEICKLIEDHVSFPLWGICIIVFVVAWIGQFLGHKIEGKKPSFLKDLQFLLIGPAWLMSFIYQKLGVRY